jgi:hypothetical protein
MCHEKQKTKISVHSHQIVAIVAEFFEAPQQKTKGCLVRSLSNWARARSAISCSHTSPSETFGWKGQDSVEAEIAALMRPAL